MLIPPPVSSPQALTNFWGGHCCYSSGNSSSLYTSTNSPFTQQPAHPLQFCAHPICTSMPNPSHFSAIFTPLPTITLLLLYTPCYDFDATLPATINAEIFVQDDFSWASTPTKIKPKKICTHEELAIVSTVG